MTYTMSAMEMALLTGKGSSSSKCAWTCVAPFTELCAAILTCCTAQFQAQERHGPITATSASIDPLIPKKSKWYTAVTIQPARMIRQCFATITIRIREMAAAEGCNRRRRTILAQGSVRGRLRVLPAPRRRPRDRGRRRRFHLQVRHLHRRLLGARSASQLVDAKVPPDEYETHPDARAQHDHAY
jgi:hypothetical protein